MSEDLDELLEGCSTEEARRARRELLEDLIEEGVPIDDLRRAATENRLPLLRSERSLTGEALYTLSEIAERTGVDAELLLAQQHALGMPRHDVDARVATEEDLQAAERVRRFLDAGLPAAGMLEVARVVGQAMENVAAASRQLVADALLQPGDTEPELSRRYAAATAELTPLMASLLEHQYRVRLREGLRREAVAPDALESGELQGSEEISVGFADLVGFTRLGERLPATDLGRLAGRLATMAADVAEPPVRLVKTVGDAAMLVSRETDALIDALLGLVEAADEEGEEFPQLSAGAARGPALSRGGDWYGSPVNLASRVTGVARPGSVLVTRQLRDAAPAESYSWSRAPDRRLKGVEGRVSLYRVRRASDDGDGDRGSSETGR
jgi:adenylate cyclase